MSVLRVTGTGGNDGCARPPDIAGRDVTVVMGQRAETPPQSPALLSGIVPPLADSYCQRPETGPDLRSGLRLGEIVVLTQGEKTVAAPAGQGGTGTTQLAAEFAHAVWSSQTVDLLAWVTATGRDAIISGFAHAADSVGVAVPEDDAATAAARFVTWLAHTERPWVLILDHLTAAHDLEDLWPSGPAGRVVVTTQLTESALRQTAAGHRLGVRIIPVSGFSRREAVSYLAGWLTADQQAEAIDLAEDLDDLPLGLAQAAAVMSITGLGCREYRTLLAERRRHVPVVPGVSAAVLATTSLAAECADRERPQDMAWPALALAAMLDPHGIPEAVLTSPAACGYITGQPGAGDGADQQMARAAISALAAVDLVSVDPESLVRTVRMHPGVHAAVRALVSPKASGQVVLAAADALMQAWPEGGRRRTQLDQALRDCAIALGAAAETLAQSTATTTDPQQEPAGPVNPLWQPEAHPLLFRHGLSLEDSGLTSSAISYWQRLVATSTRLLGSGHASTAAARDRLAATYELAGRSTEAITMFQNALADRERTQGSEAETIAARSRLAHAYVSAGQAAAAITLYDQAAEDSSRQLGAGHLTTLTMRASLADAYQASGRGREATATYASLVADAERMLGAGHTVTLAARAGLADAYLASGKDKKGIEQYKRMLTDQEAVRGHDHPDTIRASADLASALRRSGRWQEAITQYEQVLADRERTVGPDHPDTIAARANLAFGYRSAGRLREAIPGYEQTLAARQRVSGTDHADTRTARSNLAGAYLQAGRPADAITHYERALADCEHILGPGELETLTARSGLAAAQYADGRLVEAIAQLKRTLADSERYLGHDHPFTRTVRGNLAAVGET
ncbi:MAG: tetratricopeptide repeat protein [Streptosporangiaceae bacterium]|jgi:tetratricopeptide (TPR) repeat protein